MYDFNRCGVGLIEIVTEPDIGSAREAVIFAKHIQKKLSDHKITAGVMAHGNLRIDVNISLSKGDYDQNRFDFDELCGRVEIKNLNSFRSINKAIEFEISRQTKLLQNNTKIDQETRSYCDVTETTSLVRIKESKDEYIYIPEPDLGSLIIDDSMIESEKTIIRDYERINQFCLKEDTFDILKRSNLLTIFDRIMGSVDGSSDKAKSVSEFLINDLKRITMDFDPELVVKILSMYVKNEISNFEARSLIRRGIDLTSKPGQTFRCNSDIDSSSETNAFNEEKLENLAKKSADTSIELTADELKSIEEFLKLKPNKIDSPDFFMGPLLKGRTEAAELGVVDPIKLRALIAERLSWLKKNSI